MRRLSAAVLTLGLSTLLAAQPQPPASAPAGRPVHLDVFATDARGRAVEDLARGDFELREEGALQHIDDVRYVRPPHAGPESTVAIRSIADERTAAAGDARLFAVFLDEYHVSAGASTDRVREALTRFVDRDLASSDLVVIMKPLDSLFAIRMTTDREALRQAIASFEGRRGDYQPKNSYERNYIAGTPARIDSARNQVAWSAINALAIHIGGLTGGRKTLIVVGEGVDTADRRRGQEYLATRDTVIRSANRANVAIYPVDPREPAPETPASMQMLAGETDGSAIAGNLDAGLRRAAVDSSGYYLITYRTQRPDDGRFHAIEARTSRKGVSLRARKGFVAAPPDEALRTSLLAHMNDPKPAPILEPAPHASPLVRPWFGVSKGPGGTSRVTFVWEPASRIPGDRSRQGNPARLVLNARGPDGSVLFDGPVAPTGPAAMDEPGTTPARAVFDMPPGRLRLRMSIQDITSRELDTDVRDIAVRELKGVSIGTPEVLRSRNAREFRTLDTDQAVPVAAREFSRTERLLIRFPAYAPTGASPTVSAKLLSKLGQPMRNLPLMPGPGASDDNEHAIDLPLAGLAPGEYFVEVSATSGAGDVRDRVGFRVTP